MKISLKTVLAAQCCFALLLGLAGCGNKERNGAKKQSSSYKKETHSVSPAGEETTVVQESKTTTKKKPKKDKETNMHKSY